MTTGRPAGRHPRARPAPPPPAEPGGLTAREQQIFTDLVRSCASDHFTESDLPLLVAYVQACAMHEDAVAAIRRDGPVRPDGKATAWLVVMEKCQRAMVAMASKLRLTPMARREKALTPKTLDWMQRRTMAQEAERD
jgi:phage terminase small subunit